LRWQKDTGSSFTVQDAVNDKIALNAGPREIVGIKIQWQGDVRNYKATKGKRSVDLTIPEKNLTANPSYAVFQNGRIERATCQNGCRGFTDSDIANFRKRAGM